MTTYFKKVGFTGSWYDDGKKEVGYHCDHKHKTLQAAQSCRQRINHGHGGEIREYSAPTEYINAFPLED